jgi:hypothetical protein
MTISVNVQEGATKPRAHRNRHSMQQGYKTKHYWSLIPVKDGGSNCMHNSSYDARRVTEVHLKHSI